MDSRDLALLQRDLSHQRTQLIGATSAVDLQGDLGVHRAISIEHDRKRELEQATRLPIVNRRQHARHVFDLLELKVLEAKLFDNRWLLSRA